MGLVLEPDTYASNICAVCLKGGTEEPLIECATCRVHVHPRCYGIDHIVEEQQSESGASPDAAAAAAASSSSAAAAAAAAGPSPASSHPPACVLRVVKSLRDILYKRSDPGDLRMFHQAYRDVQEFGVRPAKDSRDALHVVAGPLDDRQGEAVHVCDPAVRRDGENGWDLRRLTALLERARAGGPIGQDEPFELRMTLGKRVLCPKESSAGPLSPPPPQHRLPTTPDKKRHRWRCDVCRRREDPWEGGTEEPLIECATCRVHPPWGGFFTTPLKAPSVLAPKDGEAKSSRERVPPAYDEVFDVPTIGDAPLGAYELLFCSHPERLGLEIQLECGTWWMAPPSHSFEEESEWRAAPTPTPAAASRHAAHATPLSTAGGPFPSGGLGLDLAGGLGLGPSPAPATLPPPLLPPPLLPPAAAAAAAAAGGYGPDGDVGDMEREREREGPAHPPQRNKFVHVACARFANGVECEGNGRPQPKLRSTKAELGAERVDRRQTKQSMQQHLKRRAQEELNAAFKPVSADATTKGASFKALQGSRRTGVFLSRAPSAPEEGKRRSPKHNESLALLTQNARDIESPRRLLQLRNKTSARVHLHAASSLPPPPSWEEYPPFL
ncbi:unnamed protein product [Vitrella brassicaformis CCMP3155]|uniref:PHD-type domain-containing protein n=1 Tax=Vitrella brassicaformis (strain CCMP3155) TaxID=1169540 RepID=A0A0G4GKW8_VITBC|nr:unnamed protein product [Vitrella brassicaformis CCMP3155]|eukprot:CEM30680.1 unnamed protein product [Vitrella brassicaformis CCMP3155]